jgi:GntR family transcriptional regulator, transcriptional repressor for pyruvate dehydrogenase complex
MASWSPSKPVRQRRRTFEEVIDHIRNAIRAGELRPGDKLPAERDLAEMFQVGRTSVREAIRVLEALGLVQVRVGSGPDHGVTLRHAPGEELAQLFEMWMALEHVGLQELVQFREAIESWSCAQLASRPSDPEAQTRLEELRATANAMRKTTSKEKYLELDSAFHIGIVQATGNRLAGLVARAIRGSMRTHMLESFKDIEDWDAERERLTSEHGHIFELIEANEPEAAVEASRQHVRRFYSNHLG